VLRRSASPDEVKTLADVGWRLRTWTRARLGRAFTDGYDLVGCWVQHYEQSLWFHAGSMAKVETGSQCQRSCAGGTSEINLRASPARTPVWLFSSGPLGPNLLPDANEVAEFERTLVQVKMICPPAAFS
jgi:hypothetical protein